MGQVSSEGANDGDLGDDPLLDHRANRALSYPAVIRRYGLSKDDGLQGVRRPEPIAEGLAQMQANQTDEAHLRAYARRAGITREQVRVVLEAFFRGDVEDDASDSLKGVFIRETFMARYAECSCEGGCSVQGAGLDRLVVGRLPHQPETLSLVALIAVTAEVAARHPHFDCHLIDPLGHDTLIEGASNLTMIEHHEPSRDDGLTHLALIARMNSPVFMVEGEHACMLTVDGYDLARVPFTVALRETAHQHSAVSR